MTNKTGIENNLDATIDDNELLDSPEPEPSIMENLMNADFSGSLKKTKTKKKNNSDWVDLDKLREIKPRQLKNNIRLEVHTRPAYGLILGRKFEKSEENGKEKLTHSTLGLYAFAGKIQTIMSDTLKGNIVAAWVLIQTEEYFNMLEKTIEQAKKNSEKLNADLKNMGIEVEPMTCKTPVRLEINFQSPYAMRFMFLISQYDLFLRQYMPIRQMQMISFNEFDSYSNEVRTIVRKMSHIVKSYSPEKDGKMTSQEIQEYLKDPKNEKYKSIKNMMKRLNKIPDDVLHGDVVPNLIRN